MSDSTGLSVPPAGWYPDRSDANILRWWDGQQWTDQTQSAAPAAAAFDEPVSVAAFGFTPTEQRAQQAQPATQSALSSTYDIAPGWYPDNYDHSVQRWWDGHAWTEGTRRAEPVVGSSPLAFAQGPIEVNSVATRGMIFSLVSLAFNPIGVFSLLGLIWGIQGLRRAPRFSPENARRGSALTATIVGAVVTVAIVVLTAVAIPVYLGTLNRQAFDRAGAEEDIRAAFSEQSPDNAAQSVLCPDIPVMHDGQTFDCQVILLDGSVTSIRITISEQNGSYSYRWETEPSDDGGVQNGSDTTHA